MKRIGVLCKKDALYKKIKNLRLLWEKKSDARSIIIKRFKSFCLFFIRWIEIAYFKSIFFDNIINEINARHPAHTRNRRVRRPT